MHNYSSIKWFCFSNEDEDVDIALCDMLHFISSAFELLRRNLANSLFEEISVTITREINKMFLEDVIAKNTFNNEGAKRVANDVNKSFLSMLRIFIDNPESHCVELLEACKLLSLEKGTSILLQEALKFDNDKAVEETLNELSIKVLPVEMAACVLRNKII
ncbi:RAD50-interacting protein 1-like isoform X4 [Dinothrombium tinctorium]|uniref:RAD50-interacting protein 1-like isoform X4 n=1 Tax=Dinothrombium tinctorium TaxID=1965070 RepID=A0A443QS78_9ACAR|nr:RAD50-interacting protein 1-like isoform X4 [Dinothrombium tinctorium]